MDSSGKHRIKLLNKIGKGAFGEVFKGIVDEEVCAVKTLPREMEVDRTAFQMFHREAAMLRSCNHGRIIRFKALCKLNPDEKKHGGKWALVLEFAKGGTLSDKVAQCMTSPGCKVYSNAQALSWALDVATAIEYLHLKSPAVLHRDVKLGNIVLCKEDGEWVAKLGDFGLHVVVDSMRDRLLRVSFIRGANSQLSHFFTKQSSRSAPTSPVARQPATQAAAQSGSELYDTDGVTLESPAPFSRTSLELTQQHIQVLQQQLMQDAAMDATPAAVSPVFDKDSARQHLGRLRKPPLCGDTDVGTTAGVSAQAAADCSDVYMSRPAPIRTLSIPIPGSKVSTPITDNGDHGQLLNHETQQAAAAVMAPAGGSSAGVHAGPRRSVSFRHGPALARIWAGDADQRALYAEWDADALGDIDGSMCSMVTDGTWVSGDTTATGETTDVCSSGGGANGSNWTDVETVFNMTGQTGSCMYMAPEVHLGQPYNEKADVFSFGVVLYELVARALLLFTELPPYSTDPAVTEQYATKVSQGYRPSRPKRMPDGVWTLIEACWQQEPALRPSMSKVVEALQQLLRQEQQDAPAGLGRRRSLSLTSIKSAGSVKTDDATASAPPAVSNPPGGNVGLGSSSSSEAPVAECTAGRTGVEEPKQCGCVIC